jgi:hypothetical protein
MSKEKTIYDLGIHESLIVISNQHTEIDVMRVPGGWIYGNLLTYHGVKTYTSTFVPFSKELVNE